MPIIRHSGVRHNLVLFISPSSQDQHKLVARDIHVDHTQMMAPSSTAPLLLSPTEFRELTKKPILLDCSWYLPNSPRKPRQEYLSKRIEGTSGYLDLDAIGLVHELGLKHMMPSARGFADMCGAFLFCARV